MMRIAPLSTSQISAGSKTRPGLPKLKQIQHFYYWVYVHRQLKYRVNKNQYMYLYAYNAHMCVKCPNLNSMGMHSNYVTKFITLFNLPCVDAAFECDF